MSIELKGPIHYHLRDFADGTGVIVDVRKWYVSSETPCGYWIVDEYDAAYIDRDDPWCKSMIKRARKWTPKQSPKRYTPSLKDAVFSFRWRKAVQLQKLEWQIQQAQQVDAFLKTLDDSTVTEDGFNCGTPEAWLGLQWE